MSLRLYPLQKDSFNIVLFDKIKNPYENYTLLKRLLTNNDLDDINRKFSQRVDILKGMNKHMFNLLFKKKIGFKCKNIMKWMSEL